MIKEIFSKITLIENSVNLGFGKANHWGCKNTKGGYLFFSKKIYFDSLLKLCASTDKGSAKFI